MTSVLCPRCMGDGEISTSRCEPDTGALITKACPWCESEGRVEVEPCSDPDCLLPVDDETTTCDHGQTTHAGCAPCPVCAGDDYAVELALDYWKGAVA